MYTAAVLRSTLVATVILLGFGPAFAQDDSKKQAAEHFAKAEAAEQNGQWQIAYDEYEWAHKLSPHPDVLYNMASVSERLGKLRRAAELYRRYLEESDPRPADAPKVERILADLERRIEAQDKPEPPVRPHSTNPYDRSAPPAPAVVRVDTGVPEEPAPAQENYAWRIGASYGLGVGDTPIERYQLVGAYMAPAYHLQAEFSAGLMGRNDVGVGAGGRYWIDRGFFRPFLRVLGTVGYAPNDAASDSGQAFPLSVEAGVGISWAGTKGEIYAVAGPRFTFGGVSEDDTLSDAHINDTMALTIDVGLVFGSRDRTARSLTAGRR